MSTEQEYRTAIYIAHSTKLIPKINTKYIPKLEQHFEIINPFGTQRNNNLCKFQEDKSIRDDFFKNQKYTSKWVVTHDIRKIHFANAMFVLTPKPSYGTAMELFYASFFRKIPTLVLTSEKYLDHPWLLEFSTLLGTEDDFDILLTRLIEWFQTE